MNWELSKGAQSRSTRESRYFRNRWELRSMQMQMQRGGERETENLRKTFFYQLIEIEDGW